MNQFATDTVSCSVCDTVIVEGRAAADGGTGFYPKEQSTLLFSGGCSQEEGRGNRICVDFSRLNKVIIIDPQPVPSPADFFLGMMEDRYFSKLYLTKGYYQIRVRPADVHKTAFVTVGQHYENQRVLFGMVSSGMTMTRAVRKLRDGMDNVVDNIDDLLVHTRTWEEHVQTLKELFKQLQAANRVARPTGCVFGVIVLDRVGLGARYECPEDEGRT